MLTNAFNTPCLCLLLFGVVWCCLLLCLRRNKELKTATKHRHEVPEGQDKRARKQTNTAQHKLIMDKTQHYNRKTKHKTQTWGAWINSLNNKPHGVAKWVRSCVGICSGIFFSYASNKQYTTMNTRQEDKNTKSKTEHHNAVKKQPNNPTQHRKQRLWTQTKHNHTKHTPTKQPTNKTTNKKAMKQSTHP